MTSPTTLEWTNRVGVDWRYIASGKLLQNPPLLLSVDVESFYGKLRDECLNEEVFNTLVEAQAVINRWRLDYNHTRPHSAPGGVNHETVRLNPAFGRLRNIEGCAGHPLPARPRINYQPQGPSQ